MTGIWVIIRVNGGRFAINCFINHMQKALIEMNVRLPEVLDQVHGVSGLAIIKAILNGERDKEKLLNLCDKRIIKNKKEEVLKALNGRYTKSGLFALKQAFESYQFYQDQITFLR
jgi:methionine salvage enolase-phosphatase E1